MGDSSSSGRGVSESKERQSCGEEGLGLASFTIIQETPNARRQHHSHHHHHHHSRTRSTGHSGSTLSLNSSSSFHKFCNNNSSPVSTPKFGRHDFCIGFGVAGNGGGGGGGSSGSTNSLNSSHHHQHPAAAAPSRMVRQGGSSTSSGYHSKPNSPVPQRRSALAKCENSDTSDNSSPTSHMSSSSYSTSSSGGGGGKGKKGGGGGVSSVNSSREGGGGGGYAGERRSVHKQNLYVVSFPIILLFNIFRSLLYQLFVLLRYVYCTAVQRRQHLAELQRRRQEAAEEEKQKLQLQLTGGEGGCGGGDKTTAAGDDETSTSITTNECLSPEAEALVMNSPRVPPGPGPADPLLAKQKHHHRRAFEYISKALKIDEENEGECKTKVSLKDLHSDLSRLWLFLCFGVVVINCRTIGHGVWLWK